MNKSIWKQMQAELKTLVAPNRHIDAGQSATTTIASPASFLAALEENSLFAALTVPLAELAKLDAVAPVIAHSLQRLTETRSLTLSQVVMTVGQAVYLDRFCAFLSLPQGQNWLSQAGQIPASETVRQQFDVLSVLKLEGQDVRQAIISFSTSRLATVLNQLLIARLENLNISAPLARRTATQVAIDTESRLLSALASVGSTMQPWLEWYCEDDADQLERHLRIDAYLDEFIEPRPSELVFNESFSLRDIYVPLKAQHLTCDGEFDFDQPPIGLEDWVRLKLQDEQCDQVLFIQAGFGRGKTTFCQMFADWIRQNAYPHWVPVLIALQDVADIAKDFEEFLREAIPEHLTQADPDWLNHSDTRFLFLLDGFCELHLNDNVSSLEQFFQQVGKFQESCANHPDRKHRVIVTGRSLLIKNLGRLLPPNLVRVEILPLDEQLQDQWLAQWERLTGADASGLKLMLHQSTLPEQSLNLTQEPLMLYFLAAMYRDGQLQLNALEGANVARAKFLLYQQIFYWSLNKQRPGLLDRELTPTETEILRRLLAEAGLVAVQTGLDAVPIAHLRLRLQHLEGMTALLNEIETKLQAHPLTNALVTLYHQSGQSYLRFTHNSFGKLFCSRRLHEALEDWATILTRRQQSEPLVPIETMHGQVFDLLGYGNLTPEMTEYLIVLLQANPEVDTAYLFHRLEDFYLRWCHGQFIDAPPETWPQKEVRLLRQWACPFTRIGQRQVDIYAGLNVLILLIELHGYARSVDLAEIAFYPCGRQGMPDFEPERLLQIIGYSHCIAPSAFRAIVGAFLNSANLSGVNLNGVDLSGVDLSGADLRGADLGGANLRGANLSRANLVGASLDGTNLSNTDLRGANLIGAYLRGADLSNASLSGADLSSANLIGASLSRADLRDADLSGAYLRGASFQTADLSRAYLIGASLSGASLSHADLSQVDLSDANLHGADLSDVNLRGADLSGADLIGAYLNGATLCGAKLCNANLNSADLIGADLCGADLSSANLIGAELSDQTIGAVKWSDRTKWEDVKGLDAAMNVPEALKHQLGLS